MRNASSRRQTAGYSILEIPIALFVTTIALLGLYSMTSTLVNTNKVSRHLSEATQIGQAVLEEMKAADYDEVAAGQFPDLGVGEIEGFESFRRTVTIEEDTPALGTKTVMVSVFWSIDPGESEKSVKLATIIGRDD